MKEKKLQELIEQYTLNGVLNYTELSKAVNTEINLLLNQKLPDLAKEKEQWEKEYTSKLYKDLNLESIDSTDKLKEFVESRKNISQKEVEDLKKQYSRLSQELQIHKIGFNGDPDDLDYVITKASKLLETDDKLKFEDAVKSIKETKPYIFGKVETKTDIEQKQTVIVPSPAQPTAKTDSLDELLKKRYTHYNANTK